LCAMQRHVAGPFKKAFRDYEQPWHISKFDSVKLEILELEPDIFSDKPSNEQVGVLSSRMLAGSS